MILFYLCDVWFFFLGRILNFLFLDRRIFCVTFTTILLLWILFIKNNQYHINLQEELYKLTLKYQILQKQPKLMEGQCIFASSKYYKQANSNALKVAPPLGYDFLSKKQQNQAKKQKGELIRKLQYDKAVIKVLSTKKTPIEKLKQFLLVSDSKRKNRYLSSNPQAIINRTNTNNEFCEQLESKFLQQISKQSKSTINFLNAFHGMHEDVVFCINDYALSTVLVFYDGHNLNNFRHVRRLFEKQFIQYGLKMLASEKLQENAQNTVNIEFSHEKIKSKAALDDYITSIKSKGKQIDTMFSGLHFFIGDYVQRKSNHDVLKEEIDNLKCLQYYLYLLTSGVLGNGQSAMLKIRGTIRHKTIDYIFLFKLAFSKLTVVKPLFSNLLDSQKYLMCQGYISENGTQIHKYLSENFNLLIEHGQQKLLVNPQLIFKEEFLADNIKNFNDTLIIKGLKEMLDLFINNSNLQIYVAKTLLLEKLKSYNDTQNIEQIMKQIEQNIPSEQDIERLNNQQKDKLTGANDKKMGNQQIEQRQPGLDIFELLKQTKDEKKPEAKPIQKEKRDQEDQIQNHLQKRYKENQKLKEERKKQRKQQEKKKKEKKNEEQNYNNYTHTSHFDYAEG